MASREEYIDKLETQLRTWNQQLDELQERAGEESGELKQKFEDRMKILRDKRARLKAKLEKIREAGDDSFDQVKDDAEVLWKDIKSGISEVRSILKG